MVSIVLNKLPLTQIKLFIARVLYLVVRPFYGAAPRVIRRGGIYYEADISEGLDLSLFLFGNFQKHVSNNRFISIPDDGVIFDIGANVGIMSLQFARKVQNGEVFAFEPTHYAYKKLIKNLSLNVDLAARIRPVQTFVSHEESSKSDIRAFSSWKVDKTPGATDHPVHGGTAMPADGVPTTTLDAFVETSKIVRIDFIKIDTDGHEYDVLLGAIKTVKKFRPRIIFELGQYVMKDRGIGFEDYDRFFRQLEYRLSDASNNKPLTLGNYNRRIPVRGTIDVLAMPQ